MTRIELSTEKKETGFVARCNLNGTPIVTADKPLAIEAINSLIAYVSGKQSEQGLVRDKDYIFTIPSAKTA